MTKTVNYWELEQRIAKRVGELTAGQHPAFNVTPTADLVRLAYSMGYEVVPQSAVEPSGFRAWNNVFHKSGCNANPCTCGEEKRIRGEPEALQIKPLTPGLPICPACGTLLEPKDKECPRCAQEYEQVGVLRPDGEFTTAEDVDGDPMYIRRAVRTKGDL